MNRFFLAVSIIWSSPIKIAQAEGITVKNDQFYIGNTAVPTECIVQLAPDKSGNKAVASVFLDPLSKPACANNSTAKETVSGRYTIVEELYPGQYWINVCREAEPQGCSRLEITFESRDFYQQDEQSSILAVTNVGEWDPVLWSRNGVTFNPEKRRAEISKQHQTVTASGKVVQTPIRRNCNEPEGDSVSFIIYSQAQKVVALDEKYVQEPELGHNQMYYVDGTLLYANLDLAGPAEHIQDEIYFHEGKAFLCQRTHHGMAADGFEEGVAKTVPCSVGTVIAAMRHSQSLLQKSEQGFKNYPSWCW